MPPGGVAAQAASADLGLVPSGRSGGLRGLHVGKTDSSDASAFVRVSEPVRRGVNINEVVFCFPA